MNQVTGGIGKPLVVLDEELTTIHIPINTGVDGDVASTMVTCSNGNLWPKLYTKSQVYARYKLNTIRLKYTPAVGTSINGTLYVGFTNNVALSEGDVTTPQDIESLPSHIAVPVSQPCEFTITANAMNGTSEKSLIIDQSNATTSSLSLYLAGMLFYTSANVTANVNNLGQFRISYCCMLTQPQANMVPTSAVATIDDATGTWLSTVVRAGEFGVTRIPNSLDLRYSCSKPHVLLARSEDLITSIALDGTPLVVDHTLEETDGSTVLVYNMGRTSLSTLAVACAGFTALTWIRASDTCPFWTWPTPTLSLVSSTKRQQVASKTAACARAATTSTSN